MRAKTLLATACLPIALAACGSGQAGAASHPLSCVQQYDAWARRPAARTLDRDFGPLRSAMTTQDAPRALATLRSIGHAAAVLAPVPKCADPAGYSRKAFAFLRSAGDNAGSGDTVDAMELAAVPLGKAGSLLSKLTRELNRIVPDRCQGGTC